MNAFIPMRYKGYKIASQTVSELSAIGAPTRTLWVLSATVYSLLLMALGASVIKSSHGNKSLRIVGILILSQAITGLYWPPMHQREVIAAGGATLSDRLHIAWAMVTVPFMLLTMIFGAAAFGKPSVFTRSSLNLLIAFGL